MDTVLDLVVPALVGDVLQFNVVARVAVGASSFVMDAATIVSSAPVNYFAGTGSGLKGLPGTTLAASTTADVFGTYRKTVVAGDIATTGLVTVRLRYFQSGAGTTTLNATTFPLQVTLDNLDPVYGS